MASAWIAHVKRYASKNNVSFRTAMKQASSTYKNGGSSSSSSSPSSSSGGRKRDSKGRYTK